MSPAILDLPGMPRSGPATFWRAFGHRHHRPLSIEARNALLRVALPRVRPIPTPGAMAGPEANTHG